MPMTEQDHRPIDGIEKTVLLGTASTILILALIAAVIFCLRSYRPKRVPVVERARVPQDVRAKVNTVARLRRRLHQPRRTGRSRPPTTTADVVPVSIAVSAPLTATVGTTSPDTQPRVLVQCSLAHNRNGAPRPGSYFRVTDAPSPETIRSEVRGPWAASIITSDGRITLPDSGADVAVAWSGSE